MKTLHLTNAWHARSGGIATFYRALLDAAERRRQFIRLIVPAEHTTVEDRSEFARIYHIESPAAPLEGNYRLVMPWHYLLKGGLLPKILNDEQPDVVEVCDKWSLNYFAGLLRRTWSPGIRFRPTVVGLSCERMDINYRVYFGDTAFGRWFCPWYMKWLYFPMFDHHIAISEETAIELNRASRGHVLPRGVWIRPLGVDSRLFHPSRKNSDVRSRLLQRVGGAPDTSLMLYVGRLATEKNLCLLLDTLERLNAGPHDVRLLMAGDGPLLGELQQAARSRLNGAVEFLGHIGDRGQLADIYANCDVFAHSNPKEPFGIAPLEAMASGLPLVAPVTGGVRHYAGPHNSWLCANDPNAYATAVNEIIGNPTLRESRRGVARATAESFDWTNVADAYLDLYGELHLYRTGQRAMPSVAPAFESTSGNWLGQER